MNHGSVPPPTRPTGPRLVGRYAIFDAIASGGMATVHLGRMQGQAGFAKTVAIKRLHPHLSADPAFVGMLRDEARLAARVQHPNVVAILDVVVEQGEFLLVLDYVHGESLAQLTRASRDAGIVVPPAIVATVLVHTLHGLHAAHEATDEQGRHLGIVHRDVSPQNILVGVDGQARVLDFGVAMAEGRFQSTSEGQLKGKLAYMAPEQVRGQTMDRRTDIWAASAVLWGGLVGRRLVNGPNEAAVLSNVLAGGFAPPSRHVPYLTAAMDEVVMRGLDADPNRRFGTAREMALAVEAAFGTVSAFDIGEWVKAMASETMAARTNRLREMESTSEVRVSLSDGGPLVVQPSGVHGPPRPASGAGWGVAASAPPPAGIDPSTGQPWAHSSNTGPYPAPNTYSSHGPLAASVAASFGKPKQSGVVLVGLVVFLSTLVGILGLFIVSGSSSPRASAGPMNPPPPPATTAVPTSATPSAAPVASVASVTSTVATASATAPASATAAPPVSPKPTGPKIVRPSGPTAPPTAKPGGDNAGCSSPFYVDSEGIKHVKPECM